MNDSDRCWIDVLEFRESLDAPDDQLYVPEDYLEDLLQDCREELRVKTDVYPEREGKRKRPETNRKRAENAVPKK